MDPQSNLSTSELNPLHSLDEWEDDLLNRYPEADTIAKGKILWSSGIMKIHRKDKCA